MTQERARRKTHVDIGASYAAIGASQAADLLKYPPAGSTPFEFESLLGSGSQRFMMSSALLMTWGAQKVTGLTVTVLSGGEDESQQLVFGSPNEENFAPDGTPYLRAGTLVKMADETGFEREMRILKIVDEPNVAGFVMGSSREQEIMGEEFFRVEKRDDDTVWGVVRGFYYSQESSVLGLRPKKRLKQMLALVEKQIEAITPAAAAATILNTSDDS